jgi:hypothetical protein
MKFKLQMKFIREIRDINFLVYSFPPSRACRNDATAHFGPIFEPLENKRILTPQIKVCDWRNESNNRIYLKLSISFLFRPLAMGPDKTVLRVGAQPGQSDDDCHGGREWTIQGTFHELFHDQGICIRKLTIHEKPHR